MLWRGTTREEMERGSWTARPKEIRIRKTAWASNSYSEQVGFALGGHRGKADGYYNNTILTVLLLHKPILSAS